MEISFRKKKGSSYLRESRGRCMSRGRCRKIWMPLVYFMCWVRGRGRGSRLSCYLCYLWGNQFSKSISNSILINIAKVANFLNMEVSVSLYTKVSARLTKGLKFQNWTNEIPRKNDMNIFIHLIKDSWNIPKTKNLKGKTMLNEKRQTRNYILYDAIYMIFCKRN